MNFKLIFVSIFAVAWLSGVSGIATAQQEQDVIETIKTQVGSQRQALVAENLALTEEESAVFWPVYRSFHIERDKLVEARIKMLMRFRDNFDGMTEEQAKKITDDYFALQDEMLKLRKKWLKNFRAVLSEKTTLRYFQIENKLDAIIDFDLAQMVPLAE
jgi:predicted secreted acid phosphatase